MAKEAQNQQAAQIWILIFEHTTAALKPQRDDYIYVQASKSPDDKDNQKSDIFVADPMRQRRAGSRNLLLRCRQVEIADAPHLDSLLSADEIWSYESFLSAPNTESFQRSNDEEAQPSSDVVVPVITPTIRPVTTDEGKEQIFLIPIFPHDDDNEQRLTAFSNTPFSLPLPRPLFLSTHLTVADLISIFRSGNFCHFSADFIITYYEEEEPDMVKVAGFRETTRKRLEELGYLNKLAREMVAKLSVRLD
ncbi:hypothetical protein AJ80_00455 [Polytolypa hystricis UAMH7299]|uniref:Uncharacterized protein n=1 Tax=Polytolypa hystricis (strain UAMH7299) TaxID=1447883 RepID=A0A2B7Z2R7_POLH7|nr:hypothetical protein AJ80_00455 [Polytolypa hystricis UAMH7299]